MTCRLSPEKCSQGGQPAPRCPSIEAYFNGTDTLVQDSGLSTAQHLLLAKQLSSQPLSLRTYIFFFFSFPLWPLLQLHSLAGHPVLTSAIVVVSIAVYKHVVNHLHIAEKASWCIGTCKPQQTTCATPARALRALMS